MWHNSISLKEVNGLNEEGAANISNVQETFSVASLGVTRTEGSLTSGTTSQQQTQLNSDSVLCESQGEAGDRHISASDNTDAVRKVKERGERYARREGERDGVNCSH